MSQLPPLMPFQKDLLELMRQGKICVHNGRSPRQMGKSYLSRISKADIAKGKDQTTRCQVVVDEGMKR